MFLKKTALFMILFLVGELQVECFFCRCSTTREKSDKTQPFMTASRDEITKQFMTAMNEIKIDHCLEMFTDESIWPNIDTKAQSIFRRKVLKLAITQEKTSVLLTLLALKNSDKSLVVDVNDTDIYGCTVLMSAIKGKQESVTLALLKLKNLDGLPVVDVNAKDCYGNTAFMLAIRDKQESVALALLRLKKADGSRIVDMNHTHLILAIESKNESVALRLLALKNPDGSLVVDVNAQDSNGETVLMFAIRFKQKSVALALLKLKKPDGSPAVDVNAKTNAGNTVLMSAIRNEQESVALELLALKNSDGSLLVRVNDKNVDGWTALRSTMGFLYSLNIPLGKKLLLAGADTTLGKALSRLPRNDQTRSIELVLDALKSGVDTRSLSLQETQILNAYDEFLHGKHNELRNLLLVLPKTIGTKGVPFYLFTNPMGTVFKRESIKPLLYFLAETQSQRKIADDLVNHYKL